MKTSKRILGVALVLIMVFNVFAVGTFAAGTESAVDLYLSADKSNYARGETIVLTFSAQAVEAVGELRIGGQYAIGYNSAAIQPYSSNADALSDNPEKNIVAHGFIAKQGGYDDSISSLADPSGTTVDAKNGWNTVIIYNVCDDAATSFDATSKVDLFTLKMKVADDAPDGTYVIGFNQTSYEDCNGYINDSAMGGIYGYTDDYGYGTAVNYGFNNVTITVGAGGPTNKPVVSNLETQVRWQDKNAGLLDIGFCGSVSGLTPELDTDGVTVKNVERIGFKFSRTDATLTNNVTTVDAYTLYDFTAETAGTYKFRAVVTGDDLDYKKTDALYACAFIQIGSEEILATNAKIDTTINAEYLDAVNNHNMPAFGA